MERTWRACEEIEREVAAKVALSDLLPVCHQLVALDEDTSNSSSSLPDEYVDKFSGEKMIDPVVASDGYSYDRASLKLVLEEMCWC